MLQDEDEYIEADDINTRDIFAMETTVSNCSASASDSGSQRYLFPRSQTCPGNVSPYMKENFKPCRIRRTRSHFQRVDSFMDLEEDKETDFEAFDSLSLSRKKRRNLTSELERSHSIETFKFKSGFYESMEEDTFCKRSHSFDLSLESSNFFGSCLSMEVSENENKSNTGIHQLSSDDLSLSVLPDLKKMSILSPMQSKLNFLKTDHSFLTPTRDQVLANMSSIHVDQQVNYLVHVLKIRVLALDFDNTLLSIHTKGAWKRPASDLAQYVRPIFKALVPPLLKEGMILALVSFSQQIDLMERVVNLVFAGASLGKNVLVCGGENPVLKSKPSKVREFGTQLSVKMFFPSKKAEVVPTLSQDALGSKGKCKHLQLVLEEVSKKKKICLQDILFVDDDKNNISLCKLLQPMARNILFRCELSEVEAENHFLKEILYLQ